MPPVVEEGHQGAQALLFELIGLGQVNHLRAVVPVD
jgi:hypothetical protein